MSFTFSPQLILWGLACAGLWDLEGTHSLTACCECYSYTRNEQKPPSDTHIFSVFLVVAQRRRDQVTNSRANITLPQPHTGRPSQKQASKLLLPSSSSDNGLYLLPTTTTVLLYLWGMRVSLCLYLGLLICPAWHCCTQRAWFIEQMDRYYNIHGYIWYYSCNVMVQQQ